jgi:hypothetical protein
MTAPPDEIRQRLIELHDALGRSNGADCLAPVLKLLDEHALSWADLPKLFHLWAFKSSIASKPFRGTICGIHAQVGLASTVPQRLSARNFLIKKLAERSLDRTCLPGVLATTWREANPRDPDATSAPASAPAETPNLFNLIVAVISDRVALTPAQCMVAALRQISTHVYDLFSHAPQVGIVAPASGCGKTTLRKVLEALEADPRHSHNASPAVIDRVLDRNPRRSIHIEEAENLDWSPRSPMRAIVDAAFESDGSVDRDPEGAPSKFPVFCPLTWVLRGSREDMPMAVRSRGFVMEMRKGRPRIKLPKNYLEDPGLITARNQCEAVVFNSISTRRSQKSFIATTFASKMFADR